MFIEMMEQHHKTGVEMATIALQRGEHAEIKVLAASIIAAQEAEISRMQAWHEAWYATSGTPSGTMDDMDMSGMPKMPDMSKDIKALQTATPFDLAFLDAMIVHHQGAVEMSEGAAGKGQHAEIKELAASIIRDQNKEIAQMKTWRVTWYPTAMAEGERQ
jgi:uncharacterized protein (DUF305 family)